jgi:hypothetical protein
MNPIFSTSGRKRRHEQRGHQERVRGRRSLQPQARPQAAHDGQSAAITPAPRGHDGFRNSARRLIDVLPARR